MDGGRLMRRDSKGRWVYVDSGNGSAWGGIISIVIVIAIIIYFVFFSH